MPDSIWIMPAVGYNYFHTTQEDLVQETWTKASGKLSSFRGESSLASLLLEIESNLAKDHLTLPSSNLQQTCNGKLKPFKIIKAGKKT